MDVWNFNLRSSQAQFFFFSFFLSLLQPNDGLETFIWALQLSSQKKNIL